jgi:hypothetical protein
MFFDEIPFWDRNITTFILQTDFKSHEFYLPYQYCPPNSYVYQGSYQGLPFIKPRQLC